MNGIGALIAVTIGTLFYDDRQKKIAWFLKPTNILKTEQFLIKCEMITLNRIFFLFINKCM
jgi:hypothetical protein